MQQTAHTRDNKTALGQEIPARGGDTQKMKKTLLLALALIASGCADAGQSAFCEGLSDESPLEDLRTCADQGDRGAQFNLGRIDPSRKSLEIALEFRPDFWPASLNLGILEHEAGNTLKAVKHLRRVIKDPVGQSPRAEASFHVAQILVSMGHREKAIKYFTASVRIDPEGPWADESRDYLKVLH